MTSIVRTPLETGPARLGPLARLPVFLDLAGKSAVVSGGTAAAAWKAELLAAAGANVNVFTVQAGPELLGLLRRGCAAGAMVLHERAVREDDLTGVTVAIADCADDAEASWLCEAAGRAGVLVNVIDKPQFSQFSTGSIVNRSPVVIGISTAGAAPILGQAIRRRIETLMPPALAAWAGLAKAIRPAILRRLAGNADRRSFWERLSDLAFGPPPAVNAQSGADAIFDEIAWEGAKAAGRVTLVGAGPGNAELLTLKAVRALQAADIILYDDLVSDDVLELARREAKRMLVGKRGHRDSCRQDDINTLMIKLARQGRHIVRLKSGDPTVFGRAGEEIAMLRAEGIPVEVVPGITAASALAAQMGISLTHRDRAQSVRYVTGHSKAGELPETLDWRGLADASTTLVVYMGGRTAARLAERLIAAGLSGDTPVCIAASISRPEMQTMRTTLAGLLEPERLAAISGPVLICIGAAFDQGPVTISTNRRSA